MRVLLFSPVPLLLGLSFIALMMACNMGNGTSPISTTASFSLEYRVHKGLDCAMAQDCGYTIEIAQTGALTRYEDRGVETLTVSTQRLLSQERMNDLRRLLDETGFFGFPDLLPIDNPVAGGGSASVTYVAFPAETRKSVTMMKGSPLPAEADAFISRLDSFFVSVLE